MTEQLKHLINKGNQYMATIKQVSQLLDCHSLMKMKCHIMDMTKMDNLSLIATIIMENQKMDVIQKECLSSNLITTKFQSTKETLRADQYLATIKK